MRTRSTMALLAAALAGSVPARAAAFEYAGQLGVGYDRVETWSGTNPQQYSLVPRLRLNGDLATRGYFVDPGVVDWTLRGAYDELHSTYGGTAEKNAGLTYGAYVGVLQTRESRAQVAASASRSLSDYSRDVDAVRSTGSSLSNAYSVVAATGIPGTPAITSQFGYRDVLTSGLGRADTTQVEKTLDLNANYGQPGLTTNVGYNVRWDSGSIMPTNYTSQTLSLTSVSNPADRVTASVNAGYYLREPTVLDGQNPRFEGSSADATVGWDGGSGQRLSSQYRYTHSTATDPSLVQRETTGNVVSASFAQRASAEWELVTSASGSHAMTRLGTAQTSAAGEAVGFGANWTRGLLGLNLLARAGGLQPESGGSQLAYGGTATGRAGWNLPRHTAQLSYTANYDQNLDAHQGWTTSQTAYADLSTTMPGFLSWTLRLQGTGVRGGGGLLGGNAQRTLTFMADIRYRRTDYRFDAGISDAATGPLSNPVSDSLFIPAGYNTHSRFAGVMVAVPLGRQLSAQGYTKYTTLSGPATPEQREVLLGGGLRYAIGYWSMSLDDRYAVGGTTAWDHRVNELYVRLVRAFGGM